MRKAIVIGGGLLLCLVGAIVVAQLLSPGSVFRPTMVSVRVLASDGTNYLANVVVTVNPGNLTVLTVAVGGWDNFPILSLRANTSYTVTASWEGSPPLTKTITVVKGSNCVIEIVVDTSVPAIYSILFYSRYY
jgi:hypothetical protein